jgi:hypothetical protein
MVVTRIVGTRFAGHYFPGRTTPRRWLLDDLDIP